jgi:hypothetical protein
VCAVEPGGPLTASVVVQIPYVWEPRGPLCFMEAMGAGVGDGGGRGAAVSKKAAERKRWKARCKERHLDRVEEILTALCVPVGDTDVKGSYASLSGGLCGDEAARHLGGWAEVSGESTWSDIWATRVPEACDPAFGGRLCGAKIWRGRTVASREATEHLTPRAERKRWQVGGSTAYPTSRFESNYIHFIMSVRVVYSQATTIQCTSTYKNDGVNQ